MTESDWQNSSLPEAKICTFGNSVTVMVIESVKVQPTESRTVTINVVVESTVARGLIAVESLRCSGRVQ